MKKILRITPCKVKAFSQVKNGTLYTTNKRLLCIAKSTGIAGSVSKIRGEDNTKIETTIQLSQVVKAEFSAGKLRISFLDETKRNQSEEFAVGIFASDIGDFIIQARQGSLPEISTPHIDQFDDSEVKSSLGRGLAVTGKALYQGAKIGAKVTYEGAKVGAKISSQLYQQYLKESESDFEAAAEEEDSVVGSSYRGPKGRKAEGRVADALKMTGWRVIQRNVQLQAREIDIIAEKGAQRFMVECKFGKKQINTASLDSYVMLYRNAKQPLGLSGLLFVCPTAGMSEYAMSNVRIIYPGENIHILDSRNWFRELEKL
ncbi:MAG TPA: YraN family protein [Nitrososphaerales archaeon]|nr:YraN family protein [Nitrososphaerales archaeon]